MKRITTALILLVVMVGCATRGPVEVEEREYGAVVKSGEGKFLEKVRCREKSDIKVTVGKIRCKAAACQGPPAGKSGLFALLRLAGVPSFEGIGDGLQDMFYSALRSVGCFKVLDREALEELRREMALAGKELRLASADYIVMGTITSINYTRKSGSLGGGFIPLVGAISRTKEKAELAMDVRLISVKDGEVVFSRTYKAVSGKTSYGIAGAGVGGGVGFGGALSGLSGTAMEEVARDIIIRATYDIVKEIIPRDQLVITRIAVK